MDRKTIEMEEGKGPRGGKGGLARAEQSPRPREKDKTGPRRETSCRAKSITPRLAFQSSYEGAKSVQLKGNSYPKFGGVGFVKCSEKRAACQVKVSLGGSWWQPRLSQETTEPISRQEDPTWQTQPTWKLSVPEPETSGHIVGSCHQTRFKWAGRPSNTMSDQE